MLRARAQAGVGVGLVRALRAFHREDVPERRLCPCPEDDVLDDPDPFEFGPDSSDSRAPDKVRPGASSSPIIGPSGSREEDLDVRELDRNESEGASPSPTEGRGGRGPVAAMPRGGSAAMADDAGTGTGMAGGRGSPSPVLRVGATKAAGPAGFG